MTKILFLHGNAGTHNDAKPLQQFMEQSGVTVDEFLTPDLYQQPALHKLLAGKDWSVITHSWGCYYLLNQLEEIEHHIRKIIFVNPYVIQESPLSMAARFLIQAPLIGQTLLQSSHKKQKDEFVTKMLKPASDSDIPYARELRKQINNLTLWMKAAENKIQQQNNPIKLQELTDIPAVALIGEQDQVCNNKKQLNVLQILIPNLKVTQFKNGGHGMIWTHLNEISKEASL